MSVVCDELSISSHSLGKYVAFFMSLKKTTLNKRHHIHSVISYISSVCLTSFTFPTTSVALYGLQLRKMIRGRLLLTHWSVDFGLCASHKHLLFNYFMTHTRKVLWPHRGVYPSCGNELWDDFFALCHRKHLLSRLHQQP